MECDGNKEVDGDGDEGGGWRASDGDGLKEGDGDSDKGGGQIEGNGDGG